MSAYTTPAAMAAYLATTFTPEQSAQAQIAADAVTAWIDHRTGRSWQGSGAVANELHVVSGTTIWLLRVPALSLETVETLATSGVWTAVDPSHYALVDPPSGQVQFLGGYSGQTVRVSYTADATTPPADLAYAATVLACDLIGPTLDPATAGLDSYSIGQNDITVKFAAVNGSVDGGASSAIRVVESYRRVAIA